MTTNKAFNSAALRKGLETRGTDASTEWQFTIAPQAFAFDVAPNLALSTDLIDQQIAGSEPPTPAGASSGPVADFSSGAETLLAGDSGDEVFHHLQSVAGGVDVAIIGYNTGQSLSLPTTEDRFSF